MKKLMVIIGIAAEVCAFAALASECKDRQGAKSDKGTSVQCVPESGKVTREEWNAMTPSERKEAMAKTKAENATGREKAEAARLGIPLEKWAAMTVKERCAYRKALKAAKEG